MALGNQGQIGPLRPPTSGMLRLSTLQQNKAQPYFVEYLLVGSGAGGGTTRGGGGGSGYPSVGAISLTSGTAYTVTIAAGGAAASDGSSSVFSIIIASGGGRGG